MTCTCFGIVIHLCFLTKILIYFLKINTDVDVYLNMLTSNTVRCKSSYVVVQCVVLLVEVVRFDIPL